jgi:4'-phosphopantetheinyl transferase
MIVGYTDLRDLSPAELELLPDNERGREFGSDSRRRQFQCGRALARLLLQQATGQAARDHEFLAETGGKPYCNEGPAFSITHSGQVAACAVAEAGLAGIDVEYVDERRDRSRIVDRFFSAEESAWLKQNPEGFYMLWVIKEAFVKAHGQSIFGGLEKLRCTIAPPAIQATAIEGSFESLSLYHRENSYLGLASTGEDLCNVEFLYWPPASIQLITGDDYRFVATTTASTVDSE